MLVGGNDFQNMQKVFQNMQILLLFAHIALYFEEI